MPAGQIYPRGETSYNHKLNPGGRAGLVEGRGSVQIESEGAGVMDVGRRWRQNIGRKWSSDITLP